jgi:hypothetical protein
METTLVGAGLACLIGAIVGGGLKAFGVELPLLASKKRQALLAVLGTLLLFLGIGMRQPSAAAPIAASVADAGPVLTYGTWTLTRAVDDSGSDWSNSTLKFTAQEKVPDGFRVAGYFDWRMNNLLVGREEVEGHFDPARSQIILDGKRILLANEQGTGPGLGLGSYSARLSSDGRTLLDGTWGTTAGVQNPNVRARSWEASR